MTTPPMCIERSSRSSVASIPSCACQHNPWLCDAQLFLSLENRPFGLSQTSLEVACMTRIVFCDVEGTLLLDSFPRLVLREARAMGRLGLAQKLQVAALGSMAARLRGNSLGRRLQTLAMVRSIAGSRIDEVDQVLDQALPKVLATCKPEM